MTTLALISGLLFYGGLVEATAQSGSSMRLTTSLSKASRATQPILKHAEPDSVRSEWRPLTCGACTAANIIVETRRSKTLTGDPGTITVVRVRNENAHSVVVDLALHDGEQTRDVDGLPTTHQRIQTVLHASGTPQATHEVVVRISSVRQIVVHGVERF
jgi:hypothetical protein